MSSEIVPSSLYPSLSNFLEKNGLTKTFKCFKKEASFTPGEEAVTDLLDMFTFYQQHNAPSENGGAGKKKSKKDKKRKQEIVEEKEQEQEAPPQKKKKQANGKQKVVEEEQVEVEVVVKAEKKKKEKKGKQIEKVEEAVPEQAPQVESNDQEKNKNKTKKEKKVEETPAEEAVDQEETQKKDKQAKGKTSPFQRVKADDVNFLDPRLTNNTFESKKGDDWGRKANEDLKIVRGKDFRHAKTKKKKGTYKGGFIGINVVSSVKFQYSDDE